MQPKGIKRYKATGAARARSIRRFTRLEIISAASVTTFGVHKLCATVLLPILCCASPATEYIYRCQSLCLPMFIHSSSITMLICESVKISALPLHAGGTEGSAAARRASSAGGAHVPLSRGVRRLLRQSSGLVCGWFGGLPFLLLLFLVTSFSNNQQYSYPSINYFYSHLQSHQLNFSLFLLSTYC